MGDAIRRIRAWLALGYTAAVRRMLQRWTSIRGRIMSRQSTKKMRDSQFKELLIELEKWEIPEAAVDTVHDAARASLNEVKALTEYEDGKVSRLLTVVAFLSAVIGAAFTRFASEYTWPGVAAYSADSAWWLPFSTYLAFFVY